ncbi:hypothetical protein LTR40_007534 [Exophiala xenobiotica]|nr:hypothetical protein LTR40_007534 [Exophiala xenobiotica]
MYRAIHRAFSMPRIPRPQFSIRTHLIGPEKSPERDKFLKLVKHIDINPRISQLLENPTWSVASLLPPLRAKAEDNSDITREKLHHLLRLSALPLPANEEEESSMLDTLRQQIHFVKEIQKVDTTGIEPLVAIRDETKEAHTERQITKESLSEFLALEEERGKNGTIRRKKSVEPSRVVYQRPKPWEPEKADDRLENPFRLSDDPKHELDKKRGRYFVVRKTRKDAGQAG